MTTELSYLDNGVSQVTVSDVSLLDLDFVDSWLYAIGMPPSERPKACRKILTDGIYMVSNIEHRTTFEFRQ